MSNREKLLQLINKIKEVDDHIDELSALKETKTDKAEIEEIDTIISKLLKVKEKLEKELEQGIEVPETIVDITDAVEEEQSKETNKLEGKYIATGPIEIKSFENLPDSDIDEEEESCEVVAITGDTNLTNIPGALKAIKELADKLKDLGDNLKISK